MYPSTTTTANIDEVAAASAQTLQTDAQTDAQTDKQAVLLLLSSATELGHRLAGCRRPLRMLMMMMMVKVIAVVAVLS